MSEPVIAIAHYRVKPGAEEEFKDVLRRHEVALRETELITSRPTEVMLGAEKGIDGPLFVEIFEWAQEEGSAVAHTHPKISQIWEAMGDLCESRGGRPMFEFPNVRAIKL